MSYFESHVNGNKFTIKTMEASAQSGKISKDRKVFIFFQTFLKTLYRKTFNDCEHMDQSKHMHLNTNFQRKGKGYD